MLDCNSVSIILTIFMCGMSVRNKARVDVRGRAIIRGGADKSLARPRKKQAVATKLGIYSTYSPPTLSTLLSPLLQRLQAAQKKFRMLSVQPGHRGSNDLRAGRKMATIQLFLFFFLVQGTCGSPTGPNPENRVGVQDIGSPGRPVSSGLQVPGESEHCRARTRPPW